MPLSGNVSWCVMPSPVERLNRRLGEAVGQIAGQVRQGEAQGLQKIRQVVERIRQQVGEKSMRPRTDRICRALRTLRELGGGALNGADFWLACWGLTQRCGATVQLIEDSPHFDAFLDEATRRRPATLAWQGLLDGYFRYPATPGSAGEVNWRRLRAWLAEDLAGLTEQTPRALRPHLPWLNVLNENQALLGDEPCRQYAGEALRGERDGVDRLRHDLSIPEGSWFWARLVLSQVDEVIAYGDEPFKNHLDVLLLQLQNHPSVRDDGLKQLLTRYRRCADHRVHEGLKQLALETWGSPHLIQQVMWGLVQHDVKSMVSEWLVLEDLQDFFHRLQAGGLADQRRLDFWMQFIGQISFSHIALGSQLYRNPLPNWVEFRSRRKGRYSRLDGGGGNRNAFIMKIGAYYFVEFGDIGDACYGYRQNQTPFEFSRGCLTYPDDLKDRELRVFWGGHAAAWEERFIEGTERWPGLRDLGVMIA
jgi:hypothetical protein